MNTLQIKFLPGPAAQEAEFHLSGTKKAVVLTQCWGTADLIRAGLLLRPADKPDDDGYVNLSPIYQRATEGQGQVHITMLLDGPTSWYQFAYLPTNFRTKFMIRTLNPPCDYMKDVMGYWKEVDE